MVLFTGAGFCAGALSEMGDAVPSVGRLRELLTEMVYPGLAPDDDDSLQDLFDLARRRVGNALRDRLGRRFTVDRQQLSEMYADIFAAAWYRVYTLNVDDLDEAVGASRTLPRPLISLSPNAPSRPNLESGLEVVHLNGRWADGPDTVTFSATQYGRRHPGADPLHAQCAVDVLQRPVLFVGTSLDEPPLWQAIELRKRAAGRDLRKRSFLVTPQLSRARRDVLERELRVQHLPMTLDKFYESVFKPASGGSREYFDSARQVLLWEESLKKVPLVSALSAEPESGAAAGEYLLGRHPTWTDLLEGRAAEREYEVDLAKLIDNLLSDRAEPLAPIVVTGTAGSGKSTACMRAALRLVANGTACGWTSSDYDVSPTDLRSIASLGELPEVLFMDDADRFGAEASLLARDLRSAVGHPLVILSVRSGRVERIADRLRLLEVPHQEVVVPRLTDRDIRSVLRILSDENRLGALKGLSVDRQVEEFRGRERANRELLVAMLEATSGRRFEAKLEEELEQLDGQQQFIYAMVAIGTAYRISVSQAQLLLGLADPTNRALQDVRDLTRRLLLVERPNGSLRVRHRVVGERVVRYLTRNGQLREPLQALTIALATELGPRNARKGPTYRAMRMLMNHDWLTGGLGSEEARVFFTELEPYMAWDHHYWLQRGSLELEKGDISLAENFLHQAAGIAPNDMLVQTEQAYLRLTLAVQEADFSHARVLFDEARAALEGIMGRRNHFDPHQYDIYGRGALKWTERQDVPDRDRDDVLRAAVDVVERGRKKHPGDGRLRELLVDLQNRRLGHS